MKNHFETIHKTTVKTTVRFFKWIFFIIFLYIGFSIIYSFWHNPEFFEQVVALSVGGFFAFFMGYFGWRLAQIIEEWITGKKEEK